MPFTKANAKKYGRKGGLKTKRKKGKKYFKNLGSLGGKKKALNLSIKEQINEVTF